MVWFFENATPVQYKFSEAVYEGDIETAKKYLDKGADINKNTFIKYDEVYPSPLELAHRHELVPMFRFLIEAGADVHVTQPDASGLLHLLACDCSNVKDIQLLIDKGLDPLARNHDGLTPLHNAVLHANNKVLAFFLDQTASSGIKVVDNIGNTLLHSAAGVSTRAGAHAVLDLLLNRGIDVNAPRNDGATALHLAAIYGDDVMIRTLVKARADIDARDHSGRTSLGLAFDNGRWENVNMLLDLGANPNDRVERGYTLLHGLITLGRPEIVESLLKMGASPDAVNDAGNTPLVAALFDGHYDMVKILLKSGANPNIPDQDGNSPLNIVTSDNGIDFNDVLRLNCARLLIDKGAKLNDRDSEGCVPLSHAAGENNLRMVNLLLERGADATLADNDGDTPLHRAAALEDADEDDNSAIIKALLAAGADPLAVNDSGETPLSLIEEYENDDAKKLMKAAIRQKKKGAVAAPGAGLEGDEITLVRKLPDKRVMIEIFNFAARERTVVVENHALKVISPPLREGFDSIRDKTGIELAHDEYVRKGGTLPRETIYAAARVKETLLKSKKPD